MSQKKVFDTILDSVRLAKEEAYKKGIKANTIIISHNLAMTKPFYIMLGNMALEGVPGFILGLNIVEDTKFLDYFPNNPDFALAESPFEVPDYKTLLEENKRLREENESLSAIIMKANLCLTEGYQK